jgi:hypothetical protein
MAIVLPGNRRDRWSRHGRDQERKDRHSSTRARGDVNLLHSPGRLC